ncbi:thioesterase II family protein [Marinactinospora thermotolerans]|uniref:Pyochelin biosynthetic protein PchC n=1 Tax=Marinactinospora thermotolerans DSM 45154 TaxID=1122192 RepID=A0A1T4LWX7_9ACTN|nr:alpha/beta fold hydrolase [Marinactinospora thermotolerans]SJZ59182.1 pyochelin biosynthetic protein PchC [Marinactinospora thermotolerans DSM 45154]
MTGPVVEDTRRWLRRRPTGTPPRVRLVCFPHAGGVPGFYRGWQARLPADVEVAAVCYPGRQNRFGEPPIDRMEPLADRLCAVLAEFADRPLALFGHSMGAVVAYEVTVRLAERYGIRPLALMVSAHAGPHMCGLPGERPRLDDTALAAQAGSLDPIVPHSPELLELVLPSMRADHDLLRAYRPHDPRPVDTPIIGYLGGSDPQVSESDMRSWRRVAGAGFDLRVLPGGHFYLVEGEAGLVADITAALRERTPR